MAGNVFERVEIKYILTKEQTEALKEKMASHMKLDQYGRSVIQSIYYDTPSYRLIRRSLDKPPFKEKIRLRSYGVPKSETTTVFLELKRKYAGVVYKRRVPLTVQQADAFFQNGAPAGAGQIARELSYFSKIYNPLTPAYNIIVDREAYFEVDGNLRLTIDYNPRYRDYDFSFFKDPEGKPILPDGQTIVEIKVLGAYPLWLVKVLDEIKAVKQSISKVGAAFKITHTIERKQKNV
ncbi:MAG: polyphosphate polymerase domain-containing protein [Bacilli bacterium]|nr:polyphosphate polymerase domain-containing protein [Bacilli bacterium]